MSYQIHEFTPYEGYGIFDVETLEELKQKLAELLDDRRSIWGFKKSGLMSTKLFVKFQLRRF